MKLVKGKEITGLRPTIENAHVLDGLLFSQSADGTWSLDEKLAKLLNIPLNVLLSAIPEKGMETCWAVALVICYLELKFAVVKDEWELIVKKSEGYLKKQGKVDFVATAKQFFTLQKI